MGTRRSKTSKKATLPPAVTELTAREATRVLHHLLRHHPDLIPEAEEQALGLLTKVDADAVADDVQAGIEFRDYGHLEGRAGRDRWGGYVEPTEAAWEILQEEIDPYLEDLRRYVALGLEQPAVEICRGIVLGLERVEESGEGELLGMVPDFPAEAAANVKRVLAKESSKKHGTAWEIS